MKSLEISLQLQAFNFQHDDEIISGRDMSFSFAASCWLQNCNLKFEWELKNIDFFQFFQVPWFYENQAAHNSGINENSKTHTTHDSFLKNVHELDEKRMKLMRKLQSFGFYKTIQYVSENTIWIVKHYMVLHLGCVSLPIVFIHPYCLE